MRKLCVIALVAGILSAAGTPAVLAQDNSKREQDTMYASVSHLWFSWRVTLIKFLGGDPIVKKEELDQNQKEKWWGTPVAVDPGVAQERR